MTRAISLCIGTIEMVGWAEKMRISLARVKCESYAYQLVAYGRKSDEED
jgi:hypothetical protein